MDNQNIPFEVTDDLEDRQEWLAIIDPQPRSEPECPNEIASKNAFEQIIKPVGKLYLLRPGYYKFKVVNCKREILPETATKPARPIIRLRLVIENDEANVVVNHIIFINEYNNKEIHSFFSSIGLAEDRDYITNWDVVGRTGGCHLIVKNLDFKAVNAIDRFVPQN